MLRPPIPMPSSMTLTFSNPFAFRMIAASYALKETREKVMISLSQGSSPNLPRKALSGMCVLPSWVRSPGRSAGSSGITRQTGRQRRGAGSCVPPAPLLRDTHMIHRWCPLGAGEFRSLPLVHAHVLLRKSLLMLSLCCKRRPEAGLELAA